MNNKTVILITSFLGGILFFCTYHEWLIISWHRPYNHKETTSFVNKKTIALWREKNNTWIQESVQILWSKNQPETFKNLTNAWLSWLEDEHVLSKKILVESVLFSPSGYEVYVSFDHNPFDKHWSIHQKESFISALIKTYKKNECTASYLYVLVHHEILKDSHLDFSEPWNVS
jgi:hypothetical protein